MYTSFFNLKAKPFQISSDPSFIWLGEKHKEALATLTYGVLDNKGFMLLTGDVGTGKTTLITTLIKGLSDDILYASVPDPRLKLNDFLNFIGREFQLNREFKSKGRFLEHFTTFLHRAYAEDKKVLLLIDEAQLLTQNMLEEIRLLSNIQKDGNNLLNIFFVGQNEFNAILDRPENRPVTQRMTLNYHLTPLTQKETEGYIKHRLKVAGTTESLFSPEAIREIYLYSKGTPRRINVICDHCLLRGFVKDRKVVDGSLVRECAKDLEIPKVKGAAPPVQRQQRQPVAQEIVEQPVVIHRPAPPARPVPIQAEDSAEQYSQMREEFRKASETGTRNSLFGGTLSSAFLLAVPAALLFGYYLYPAVFHQAYDKVEPVVTEWAERFGLIPPSSEINNRRLPEKAPLPPALVGQEDLIGKQGKSRVEGGPERGVEGSGSSILQQNGNSVGTTQSKTNQVVPGVKQKVLVRFESDSSDFFFADIEHVDDYIQAIKNTPNVVIVISGHTDSHGSEEYNYKISLYRANMVKSFLLGKGLEPYQLKVQAFGSMKPIATNETAEGRWQNRRVELDILTY